MSDGGSRMHVHTGTHAYTCTHIHTPIDALTLMLTAAFCFCSSCSFSCRRAKISERRKRTVGFSFRCRICCDGC